MTSLEQALTKDMSYKSETILLKNLKGNNLFNEDRDKIPQNNMQTCTLNLKNIRADNFGSEGSSSECSFDDFENSYETASVNSQLSALEELEEFEDLNDVNHDQRKDASSENGISKGLESETKDKNERCEDGLTTDVKVCAKNDNKTATKAGKIRCRISSRDSALGTRKNSFCSQSSETGSESSANFYGPGDKCHEVKVQRVSLTSLPGFDMPDFIRANLEASLEKIEHRNNEEQDEEATKYKGKPVENSVTDELLAKAPPVSHSSDDSNSSTVIAKLKTRKRAPKIVGDEESKFQQFRSAKTDQQEEAKQSLAKKSTDAQKEEKDLEVRPKQSNQQKPSLETIKITESQIVMIVTNEQKTTSPSPKVPLFQSDEDPASFSKQQMAISENIPELGALGTKDQQFTTNKVSNEHDVQNGKFVNEISEKERSVFKESAVEAKDKMTSDMDNQSTDSAKWAIETSSAKKHSDLESRNGTPSLNEKKSKIPLSTRQLSLERKKVADNFENSKVSYELQEAVVEARALDDSSRLQFRLSPSEDNNITLLKDWKTKPASPTETETIIPLLSQSEKSQESVGVYCEKQKPSKIPVSSKTVQREEQVVLHGRCPDMIKSNNEQMPDVSVSATAEDCNIPYKTPEKALASNGAFLPVTKASKIPVLSKKEQSQSNFISEKVNVQSLESCPNQNSKKEEQQINFRKDDSQILLPIEKKSGIPLPKSGQANKTVSENNQQNMAKVSAVSTSIGNKSKASQSRIPLPKTPTVKFSSSPEDQNAVWIKNEESVEEEDSYILHNPLATSTPIKQSSQLPMANLRMPKMHNKNEELEDEHDSENDDGRQTLLQRYMMSEDRRIEEIIRLQKTNPKI